MSSKASRIWRRHGWNFISAATNTKCKSYTGLHRRWHFQWNEGHFSEIDEWEVINCHKLSTSASSPARFCLVPGLVNLVKWKRYSRHKNTLCRLHCSMCPLYSIAARIIGIYTYLAHLVLSMFHIVQFPLHFRHSSIVWCLQRQFLALILQSWGTNCKLVPYIWILKYK